MKLLLRIYMLMLFSSFSLEAGTENSVIDSRFPLEVPSFASDTSIPVQKIKLAVSSDSSGTEIQQEFSPKLDFETEKCLSEVKIISEELR